MSTKADVLAAIEAREQHRDNLEGRDLWAIGKALIGYCGEFEFTPKSKNDGSHAKLKAVSKDAIAAGWREYTVRYLSIVRQVATVFKGRIQPDLSFTHHREAGSPDFLDWVVDERGTDIQYREIKKLRKRWQQLSKQQRKKKYEAAKEEVRRAPTPEAKKKAEEKAEELRGMPDPSPTVITRPDSPSVATMNAMADVLDADLQAQLLLKEIRTQQSKITAMRERIDADYIDALVEKYEEIAKVATQVADGLGKDRTKRFATITGGKAS